MKLPRHWPCKAKPSNNRPEPHGGALLLIVMALGTIALIAASMLSRFSIEEIGTVAEHNRSLETREHLMGCLEETLVNFKANPDFSESEIVTEPATCSLSVSIVGAARTIVLSLTEGNITRTVRSEIIVEPFAVTRTIEE